MTTASTVQKINDISVIPSLFSDMIADLLDESADNIRIHRLAVTIPNIDILDWYTKQNYENKLFWSDRDDSFIMAGINAVHSIQNGSDPHHAALFENIHQNLQTADKYIRYYGGFRFDATSTVSEVWASFGTSRFILPRFEMTRSGDICQFACNISIPEDLSKKEEILSTLSQLDFSSSPVSMYENAIIKRIDDPDKGRWMEIVNRAVRYCTSGRFDKIVLARKTSLQFKKRLQPDLIFQQLYKKSSNCFHFCFQENSNKAFVGATPERLYLRTDTTVKCEAVAGTRRRDSDLKIDRLLGEELMESKKDVKEHSYVVDSIIESITPYINNADEIPINETTLLKLARVQHLLKRFRFSLKKSVTDFELINALHPTAAVGGYPKDCITDDIFALEQFDRGWYAAPVGWIGRDASEFAVAIRSGLIDDDMLYLYSGAGIIDGSVSESEWDEIENKISNFLKALS